MGKMKSIISAPEKLNKNNILDHFDCGNPELNICLKRFAFQNQRANATISFVTCFQNNVIAYYSLTVGSIEHQHATPRGKKGLARHSIPVMIIARLAVNKKYQRQGIGKGLLKDVILRTLNASEHAGIRAIFVHAKDEKASKFYKRFDFEPCPIDPFKLMLLLKDPRNITASSMSL